MSKFEDNVRTALRAEEQDLLSDLQEPSMFNQALDTLKGSSRGIKALAFIFTFVFFILQIWTAVQFFNATETQAMIGWATGFLFCALAVAMLKMWFWMQMDKYVVLREIKRLEWQVAQLAARQDA